MNVTIRLLFVGAVIAIGIAGAAFRPTGATSQLVGNRVLDHALKVEQGLAKPDRFVAPMSGGVVTSALEATGFNAQRAASAHQNGNDRGLSSLGTQGCQNTFKAKGLENIRVNQDCSLRRQAEEVVVTNPTNPKNVIAGQNDSRIGFNHCGYAWSLDGGDSWGDQVPPFYQFVGGDGHTFDACSDPTATFDSQGNAYVGGVLFDITSAASAFVVAKSNAGIGGAFYHSPDPAGGFQTTVIHRSVSLPTTTTRTSLMTRSSSSRTRPSRARRPTTSTRPGPASTSTQARESARTARSSSASQPTVGRPGRQGSRSAAQTRPPAPSGAPRPIRTPVTRIRDRIRSSAVTARSTCPSSTAIPRHWA